MGYLGNLLHLSDPTLPIGSYSHSAGLETYVQVGLVNSVATTRDFIFEFLASNFKTNDASYMMLAYQAAESGNIEALIQIDREITAIKAPKEIRIASQKLGTRMLKIFQRNLEAPLITGLETAIKDKKAVGHYPLVYAIYAHAMRIPLKDALFAFYYNAAVGLITNSVKLVPLGQLDGLDILFEVNKIVPRLIEETLTLDRDLVGTCSAGLDIRSMQHERLYSRLYMS
jgi:urease accessory protein